ncbi:MAG: alcohol dehydrogenase catalytic domain-containing protein [Clostridia bacterium]|nr:alcohol dehydrogenase catalytic domain-containing protein [Clostridia bacterium]
MKTWFLDQPKQLRLHESPPTALQDNLVKVKIEQILLTNSLFGIYSGKSSRNYPFVMGRNAIGVVSEVSDKSMLRKMDRVAIEPYIPCEQCEECRSNNHSDCSEIVEFGQNADGLLQNFIDLPCTILHQLPDNLSNEKALFVSYVSFCLNIVDSLKLEKGRHIAIFSSTKTGLILAQLVAYYQAVPIFCSNEEVLVAEARKLGILYCINTEEVAVAKEIQIVTGGRMCKELVYFSDSEFKMKDVYDSAAQNATICLAGYSNKDSRLSVAQMCQKHLKIMGVYNGLGNFSSAINLLVTGKVNVDNLIGDVVSFEKLDQVLANTTDEELKLKSKIIKVE